MSHLYVPKARHKDLVTTKVGDETVVYDISSSKAYCLNHVTTQVWKACDGHSHVESLLNQVKQAGFPDVTEDLIKEALIVLFEANLLIETCEITEQDNRYTRREALQLMGKGTIASLPLLTAVEIQPAIAQVSNPCSTVTNCSGGCSNGNVRCYVGGNGCGCNFSEEQCNAVNGQICS